MYTGLFLLVKNMRKLRAICITKTELQRNIPKISIKTYNQHFSLVKIDRKAYKEKKQELLPIIKLDNEIWLVIVETSYLWQIIQTFNISFDTEKPSESKDTISLDDIYGDMQ